jgi:hypothetical protein
MKRIFSLLIVVAMAITAVTLNSCKDKDTTPASLKGTSWGAATVSNGDITGMRLGLKSDGTLSMSVDYFSGSAVTKAEKGYTLNFEGTWTYTKPNLTMTVEEKLDATGASNFKPTTISGVVKGNELSFSFQKQTFVLRQQ